MFLVYHLRFIYEWYMIYKRIFPSTLYTLNPVHCALCVSFIIFLSITCVMDLTSAKANKLNTCIRSKIAYVSEHFLIHCPNMKISVEFIPVGSFTWIHVCISVLLNPYLIFHTPYTVHQKHWILDGCVVCAFLYLIYEMGVLIKWICCCLCWLPHQSIIVHNIELINEYLHVMYTARTIQFQFGRNKTKNDKEQHDSKNKWR